MVRKDVIMKKHIMKLKDMQKLTTKNIAMKIMDIMKKHIGYDYHITRPQLFRELFLKDEEETLADWLRWEFVKKAMHLCRVKTKCFISSKRSEGHNWVYFVVADEDDAGYYVDNLNKNINRIRAMQQRAMKSAREQWYKEDWVLPHKTKKLLEKKEEEVVDELFY